MTWIGSFERVFANPSEALARGLEARPPSGWRVVARELPVSYERGPAELDRFLEELDRVPDLLLAQGGAPARLLGDPDRAAMLEREAAAWTMDELLQGLAVCRDAREALAVNVGPRLTLEIVLARLALRAA